MTLVSSSIPNFLNGISQQPMALRLPTQGDLQINGFSSVVEGQRKRPPSIIQMEAVGCPVDGSKVHPHIINRDSTEAYKILATPTGILAYDLKTRQAVPVAYEGAAQEYLQCDNPLTDIRMVTVADYTFVLNRTVKAESSSEVVEKYIPQAMIWAKVGTYGGNYDVTLDGIRVSYKTPSENRESLPAYEDGSSSLSGYDPTPPRFRPETLSPKHAATDTIAQELYDLLRLNPTLGPKFFFTRRGSSILVKPKPRTVDGEAVYDNFTISSSDSQGDQILRCLKGSLQNFSELPARAFDDFRLKVRGDGATKFDDYHVRYEGSFTSGTWIEDIADRQKYKLDPATMPHALIRQADGSFLFAPIAWEPRKVGSAFSNPLPSFIGRKIRDLFFFRNRLGMIAEEQVVMSGYGEYYNFFRATATARLDTDPIDVAVAHTSIADLHHALAFNRTLVLFGKRAQFQISPTESLTYKTVGFDATTEYSTSEGVRPVGLGRHSYFLSARNGKSTCNEYYTDRETATDRAVDITDNVPRLLPGDITQVSGSSAEGLLVSLSDSTPNELYVHKFHWDKDEKVQSGWSVWRFPEGDMILSAGFLESTLWITVVRGGKAFLESVDMSPGTTDEGYGALIHLDHRVGSSLGASFAYVAGQDETRITIPYPVVEGLRIVAGNANPEVELNPQGGTFGGYKQGEVIPYRISADGGSIVVDHELTDFVVGVPYEHRYRMSTLMYRAQDGYGNMKTVDSGRLQLRRMTVRYVNSGYFEVHVLLKGRDPEVHNVLPRRLPSDGPMTGRIILEEGTYSFPIGSKNDRAVIELVNPSHLPSSWISAEWEAEYTPRARTI